MGQYSGTLFYDNASDLSGGCDVVFTGYGVSFLLYTCLYNLPFILGFANLKKTKY